MFRKAHFFFTALYGGTTSAIIVILSLFYLYTSQKNLWENPFDSFENDIGTIVASLEQSSDVSMQWLAGIEFQNSYEIFIIDNNVPFLYNTLHDRTGGGSLTLLTESLNAGSGTSASADTASHVNNYSGIRHSEYRFHSPSANRYYFCSLINMERDSSVSQIVILDSLESVQESIRKQRLLFLCLDLGAAAVLFTLAWFFTGFLLKPLRENHEKQTRFIAAASHELRTPLAVILASSECCRTSDEAQRDGFFQTIAKEGRRMNDLINDMLTLTRADIQNFPLNRRPSELDTICLNAYESFEPLCRREGLSLSLVLPDAPIERCTCDPDSIAQALSVLLHNAVSYTPPGGFVRLTLSYHKDRHASFEITVSDTGIGISDEDKRHIFDRFYRSEKSRSSKEHFGLGLAIAHEIIRSHHGSITVQDNPGGGSVFTVRLP